MKCKVFLKHMEDYINDRLSRDISEAMEQHMEVCSTCRKAYNKEKEIDNLFSIGFNNDRIKFQSTRNAVLANINTNKYSYGTVTKVQSNLAKNYKSYGALAAAVLCFIFLCSAFIPNMKINEKIRPLNGGNLSSVNLELAKDKIKLDNDLLKLSWKEDLTGKHTMAINEKQEQSQTKASILVGEKGTNEATEIVLNNGKNPVVVYGAEWLDSNNILALIGDGKNKLNNGDKLIILNVDSLNYQCIYRADMKKEQLRSFAISGSEIMISNVYLDDSHTQLERNMKKIKFKDVTDKMDDECVRYISDVAKKINNNDFQDINRFFNKNFNENTMKDSTVYINKIYERDSSVVNQRNFTVQLIYHSGESKSIYLENVTIRQDGANFKIEDLN